jgi:hypothetical protein
MDSIEMTQHDLMIRWVHKFDVGTNSTSRHNDDDGDDAPVDCDSDGDDAPMEEQLLGFILFFFLFPRFSWAFLNFILHVIWYTVGIDSSCIVCVFVYYILSIICWHACFSSMCYSVLIYYICWIAHALNFLYIAWFVCALLVKILIEGENIFLGETLINFLFLQYSN